MVAVLIYLTVMENAHRFECSVVEEIHTDGSDDELYQREHCAPDTEGLRVLNQRLFVLLGARV